MIRKKYIFIPLVVIIVIISVGALGYYLFLSKVSSGEMVFAPTEVGAPQGDKITKDIGPAGGSIASPDGRLTLTVPQNTLTDTVAFSIQPITNKAGGGLGLAYRLEPNGKTFTTPLKISVRYDEHDLEGTVPQALSMAYQDEKGAWHAQTSAKLDQAAKTLTVSTTHFTDFSVLSRLRLSPAKATLHVGGSLVINLVDCKEPGFWDKLLSRPQNCTVYSGFNRDLWRIQGAGTFNESGGEGTVVYEAPGKKPTPNHAWVIYSYELEEWDETRSAMVTVKGELGTEITIVDGGYTASGSDGDLSYSGTICDLTKEFTVIAHTGFPWVVTFKFTPLGDGRSGTGTISSNAYRAVGFTGGGSYKIEGFDGDKPRIILEAPVTVSGPPGTGTKPFTHHIDLIPLNGDECGGG